MTKIQSRISGYDKFEFSINDWFFQEKKEQEKIKEKVVYCIWNNFLSHEEKNFWREKANSTLHHEDIIFWFDKIKNLINSSN